MTGIVYILPILLWNILGCDSAGDFCYQYLTYSYSYGLEYYSYYGYCDAGCCGYTVSRTCCLDNNNTGLIVGIVVGVILFIAALAIIVFCIHKHSAPILPPEDDIDVSPSECYSDIDLGPMYGEDGNEPFHPPPGQTAGGPPYDVMGHNNRAMTVEASVSPPPPYTDENKY